MRDDGLCAVITGILVFMAVRKLGAVAVHIVD